MKKSLLLSLLYSFVAVGQIVVAVKTHELFLELVCPLLAAVMICMAIAKFPRAMLLVALLLCPSLSARECASANMPQAALDAIERARFEYTRYGAKLPRTRFIWAEKGQVPAGAYAVTYRRRGGCSVIFVNATDLTWPRWEVSLDKILLHEMGHARGWTHQPADSVMEEAPHEHLSQSDLSRLLETHP